MYPSIPPNHPILIYFTEQNKFFKKEPWGEGYTPPL
jgi:hypothetical protein